MQAGLPKPALARLLLLAATLALPGCWTPPRSDVQPPGEAGLVADHIVVKSRRTPAVVQAVDAQARTVSLLNIRRRSSVVYPVDPRVSRLGRVYPGERVRVTLVDQLTVYVLRPDQPVIAGERIEPQARVLSVDPSYRRLVVQYPDGEHETFKVGLVVNLRRMHAGDAVVMQPVDLTSLKRRR